VAGASEAGREEIGPVLSVGLACDFTLQRDVELKYE
jgi:hypothetical protein